MRLPDLPGYDYEDLLGEDPFGWSYICSSQGGERRVVKAFKSQATNDRFLHHYFKVFADPESRPAGTVRIHHYRFQDDDTPTTCSAPFFGWRRSEDQPWQLTSLKRLMHLISGEQAFEIVRETAQSVASAHAAGLFHGGLRPGSIFLSGSADGTRRVQVGDFGQIFMGGLQYLEAGDLLFYASPEQMETGDFSGGLGYQWDIYAFGVIAFQLLTGHLPRLDRLRQQGQQQPEALRAGAISYGQLTPLAERFIEQLHLEKPVEWPDEATDERDRALREVIEACLEFDPKNRPATFAEVLGAVDAAWAPEKSFREEPVSEVSVSEEPAAPEPEGAEDRGLPTSTAVGDVEGSASEAEPVTAGAEEDDRIAEELDEFGPATASASRPESKERSAALAAPGAVVSFFGRRPERTWQAIAAVAMIGLLWLGYVSFSYERELQDTREDLKSEAAELQASVEKQAAAYRRLRREKQQNSRQMQSELNEIEESRSSLLGEVKLARQILRQTQENGDQFFRLVLENRDTDVPGFRGERAEALVDAREHYERLVDVYGDAPDFIVSSANALFYLGRIYREMGRFGEALASFGEAERRYAALLEDAESAQPRFLENIAIAKHALGELSMREGKYAVARHYFTESSRFWAELRSAGANRSTEAAIHIHENSLAVAECELAIGRLEAALDGARSIGMQLTKLQEEHAEHDRIVGALAKSFAILGRTLALQEETEAAKEAYQQASNLFARAVKLNAAVDAHQLGLGDSIAQVGLLSDDIEKLEKAVDVLGGVVEANPHEPLYQRTLADVYGVLARNQRDGGHPENAIALEREAIAILRPIIEENRETASPEVLHSYSRRVAHLAELLGDAGEFDESREPLGEAIAVLERLAGSEDGTAEHRRTLARARGLAGFACLKSGDETGAREHLELAKSAWENYVQSHPDDSDAVQAVRWTTDQLEGL